MLRKLGVWAAIFLQRVRALVVGGEKVGVGGGGEAELIIHIRAPLLFCY